MVDHAHDVSKPQGPQMTGQAVSDFLGFSPRWLAKLVDQGYLERKENKLFDLIEVQLGYIRFLKDADRRAVRNAPSNAMTKTKIRKLQIDIAKTLDALIETDLAEQFANESLAIIRDIFLNLEALPDPEHEAAFKGRMRDVIERGEKRFRDFFANIRAHRPHGFDAGDPDDNDM